MADMNESPSWDEKIQIIGRSERVTGGQDGVANRPLKQLANRTRYLKERDDSLAEKLDEKVSAIKSFDTGGVLQSPRDEIIYKNMRMVWTGIYPKVVIAGSSPENSGGVAQGAWAYTSDAQLRKEMAETQNPARMIGNFFGGEGPPVSGKKGLSLRERIARRGQFGIVQTPGDPPYLAGNAFGDDEGNVAALTMDARGRLSGHAFMNGKMVASGIGYAFCEVTGHHNKQFPNVILKAHSPLIGDDNLMPGVAWMWDAEAGKMRLAVLSPLNPGNDGYPVDGYDQHVNLLSSYYDTGYGINHSFDHFNTTDVGTLQWGKLCTIKKGKDGGSVKKFSALITSGSYVDYEQGTYLLDVNGQNLIETITDGNMNRGNVGQWIKFVRLSDSTATTLTMDKIPEIGVLVNTLTGHAEIWMKLPVYSPRVSVTVLALSNPTYVNVDWSDWKENTLREDEPGGITYAMTYYPINNQNYVKTNSGQSVYAPYKVLRVKDKMTAKSTYNRMTDFLEYGFTSYGEYHAMNKYSGSGVTVSRLSVGTYSVSGCTLSDKSWKVKQPVSWLDGSNAASVSVNSSSSGAFTFSVKDSAGNLVDIPDGTWVDFHVR